MTMLEATAVIRAVDKASGVFHQVARAAAQASGRYQAVSGSIRDVGSQLMSVGALSMAAPSALSVSSFGHNQYEWDRAVHSYRAIAEVSDKVFNDLTAKIRETSNSLGVNKMELLDAAKGWVEIGGKAESVIPVMDRVAQSAKIMGIGIRETLQESRGLLMAFGMNPDDKNNIIDMENFFLVASKMVRGGGHALIQGMKNAAPIAGMMAHISKEQTAAMLSTIIDAGFDPGEAGNAMKTGLMRLYAPSKEMMAEMRAAGIQRENLFNLDTSRIRDTKSLAERIRGALGLEIGPQQQKIIADELAGYDGSRSLNEISDALNKRLSDSLGLKKGDPMNRRLLQKTIEQHMNAAVDQLNIDEFFKLRQYSKQALVKIFGKDHGAKLFELVNNEKKFRERLKAIEEQKDGAIDRKSPIYFQGFAYEFDRVKTAYDNLMNSVGGSGITSDFAAGFQYVSDMLREFQKTDPNVVRAVFYGLAGLAALPALGAVMIGAQAAITGVVALATSPVFLTAAGILGGAWLGTELVRQATTDWEKFKETLDGVGRSLLDSRNWNVGRFSADPVPAGMMGPFQNQFEPYIRANQPTIYERMMDSVAETFGTGKWSDANNKVGPGGLAPLSLMDLSAMRVEAELKGQADVTGKVDVNVKVELPDGLRITSQTVTGGDVSGTLDTGRSMPDTRRPVSALPNGLPRPGGAP